MKKFIVEQTDHSPKICLDHDKNIFTIIGESHTENSESFYRPVINWFKEYKQFILNEKSSCEFAIEIHMDYYNSATARSFVEMFSTLQNLADESFRLRIRWFYLEFDEDMKLHGELLSSIMPALPFDIICQKKLN